MQIQKLLGTVGLALLVPIAPAFAASTITITAGNDLLFNNYLYSPSANVEQVAAALDDPVLRNAGPHEVWSFEFKPDEKTTGLRTDDTSMQFDIIAPFAEIIRIHLIQTASLPGRAAATIAPWSDCAGTELSSVCNLLPVSVAGIVAPPPTADVHFATPFLPVRTINVNVTSLPFVTNFANFGWDLNPLDFEEAPEPGALVLMACGLGLIALRARKRPSAKS